MRVLLLCVCGVGSGCGGVTSSMRRTSVGVREGLPRASTHVHRASSQSSVSSVAKRCRHPVLSTPRDSHDLHSIHTQHPHRKEVTRC